MLNNKTVLFQTIQFRMFHLFALSLNVKKFYITYDRTQSVATTPGQSGPGSNGNEGVLRIPQSLSITGTLSTDSLVFYPGHSLVVSYPSADMQSVYSTAPADWVK